MRAPAVPRRMKTDRAASRIFASVSGDLSAVFFLAIRFNCLVNIGQNDEAESRTQRTDVYAPEPASRHSSQAGFDLDLRSRERARDRAAFLRLFGKLLEFGVIETWPDDAHVEH